MSDTVRAKVEEENEWLKKRNHWLNVERDKLAEQTAALRAGVEHIAKECDEIAFIETVDKAKGRTWRSVASRLRALLLTADVDAYVAEQTAALRAFIERITPDHEWCPDDCIERERLLGR